MPREHLKYLDALKSTTAPVTATDEELARFSTYLQLAEELRRERLERALARDFPDGMDIVRWIVAAQDDGDADEALWRGFLGAHFGEPLAEPGVARSAGKLLCGFGTLPEWIWTRIWEDPVAFLKWLLEHRPELEALEFGNHRKFEAKKPDLLYEVIVSFVRWIRRNGGAPSAAFSTAGELPEVRFDLLFHQLGALKRFGRLGRFDLLCLYADLRLLPIRPGSCYLVGASGPLEGARRLWGQRPAPELGRLADAAAAHLGIPFPVFEDALCNWQKR